MLEELYTSGGYLEKNPLWHVDESPWKAEHILRMLAKHSLHPKTICEVGCGVGEILRIIQRQMSPDCDFWGYDISPQAIALAQTRANDHLHFSQTDFTTEPETCYDLLMVMDVIEHLEDYFSFLRNLKSRGTYKLFQFPLDISVQSVLRRRILTYRQTFGHLHYFTKELAVQTLRDAGYEVLDTLYATGIGPIPTEHSLVKQQIRYLRRGLRILVESPGKLTYALNPDLAVRVFGGWRLLVLAK